MVEEFSLIYFSLSCSHRRFARTKVCYTENTPEDKGHLVDWKIGSKAPDW